MRICIPIPAIFRNMEFTDAIPVVKSLGFDAVETYDYKRLDLKKVRGALDDSGVELLSFCTTNFELTDPARRDAWLAGLRESCEAAKGAGVGRLITQVGQDTGARREFQHDSIVAGLRAAKNILEDSGVTIMIEPLNTYVNHPGYYLWSSAEAFLVIREVNHPLVKVCYDIYHQQIMEGNIIQGVTKNLDCIAHLHAAGHPGRNELQYGENDYEVIFNAIDEAGYRGACGLEYSPRMDPVESLKAFRAKYMK